MRLFLRSAVVCLIAFGSAYCATPVVISDTLQTPINGRPAIGTVNISWPTFVEPDGTTVPAGSQNITVAGNGQFTANLYPTDQASLAGSSVVGSGVQYSVTYALSTGQSITDHWNVPTTASVLKIANVFVRVPGELKGPSGTANPATCTVGDQFFNSTSQSQQMCVATNTWDPLPGRSLNDQRYLKDLSAAGIVFRGTGASNTRAATNTDVSTALGYTPPNPTNALSEYTVAAAGARANLGIGTAGTHPASDFVSSLSPISISLIPQIPVSQITGLGTAATRNESYFLLSSQLGQSNGPAKLDNSGKLLSSQYGNIDYTLISNAPTPVTRMSQLINDANYAKLSDISTAGKTGSYADLSNKPALNFDPVGSATVALNQAFKITNNLSELTDSSAKAAARNSLGLSTLAATGAWTDISGKPTSFTTDWSAIPNKPAFGTIITKNIGDYLGSSTLGTTVAPLVSGTVPIANIPTVPSTKTSGFANVATSGSYLDLTNKPSGLAPTGAASGDLCASFPSPIVCGLNGINLAALAGSSGGILKINSAGVPGLAGPTIISQALGYTPSNPGSNLSDLQSAATARTNLGLGSIATQPAPAFLADPSSTGIVFRGSVGMTRVAHASDITSALGYTPIDAATKNVAGGVAPTDGSNKVPLVNIPTIPYANLSGAPTLASSATVDTTNATNITSGTLNVARLPAIPSTSLSDSSNLARLGSSNVYSTSITPIAPAANKLTMWVGATTKNFEAINENGVKTVMVQPTGPISHQVITSIDESGHVGLAQLSGSDITGIGSAAMQATSFFLSDPGLNGVLKRTASGTTGIASGSDLPAGYPFASLTGRPTLPAGAIVGTTDAQTLTNKLIDASEITTGVLGTTQMPAFTGDVTKPAGSGVQNLATVNATPGTCGDTTHSCQITSDAQGRIRTQVSVGITGAGGDGGGGTGNVSGSGLTASQFIQGAGGSAIATTGKTIPTGAVVGTTDIQTLTNKSIDASEINSGTIPGARLAQASSSALGVVKCGSNITCASDGTISTTSGGGNITGAGLVTGNIVTATGATAIGDSGVSLPGSALVGISDAQTLTNKSISASQVNSGTLAAARIPIATAVALGGVKQGANVTIAADGTISTAAPGSGNINGASLVNGNIVTAGGPTTVADSGLALPGSAVVGINDVQTLTNKSISATQVNSGTLGAARLPAFAGDVNVSAGTTTTTLATANLSPGTCGDSTHSCQIVTDGTGRVRSQAAVAISGGPGGSGNVSAPSALVTGNLVQASGASTVVDSGKAVPVGSLVGTNDTQTITNKSIDASEVNSGTLSIAQTPALTGDVTKASGSAVSTVTRINGASLAGLSTGILKNTTGTGVPTIAVAGTDYMSPSAAINATQMPALSGDVSSSSGSAAVAVTGLNGVALGGLATGILKNTTTTGVPTVVAAPTGAIVGTTDTQTLTNKTVDGVAPATLAFLDATSSVQTQLNSKSSYPGSGIPLSTGTAWGTSVAAPAGTIVGTTDIQTLTNKSIDASEVNSGTINSARMPALTGDVTTISGFVVTTVGRVNGTSVPANSAGDQALITNGAASGMWSSLPNCADTAGNHLNYNSSTHGFTCGTSTTGPGGSGTVTHTLGGLTANQLMFGNGVNDSKVGDLTGDVTTSGSAATTVSRINGVSLATLTTGLLKNTTTTGVPSIAVAGTDYMSPSTALAATQLPALSGDVTSSAGSAATTVAKIRGTTVPVNSASDQTLITNASASGLWASLPSCLDSAGNHLNYNTSTHAFSCGNTGGTASGTGTVTNTLGALTSGQIVVGNGTVDVKTGNLSGDVTTTGSTVTTLKTVNLGPGQCGDETHVCKLTTDGQGRVISQAGVAITTGTAPNSYSFTGATSVVINHNLNTLNVLVGCRDNASPSHAIEYGGLTFNTVNQVTVGFTSPVTGACTVNGGVGPAGVGSTTYTFNSPLSLSGTAVSLLPSGVTAASYTSANITVDAFGRVTAAANGPGGTGFSNPMTGIGELIVGGTGGGATRLANPTTAGLVFTSNGTGVPPSWQASSGGPGSSFYQTLQASGTPVTQRAKFNVAAGTNMSVVATDNGTDTTTFTLNASGSSGSGVPVGTLSAIPGSCTSGQLYFATDQAAGQQLYYCTSGASWAQYNNLGGSAALAYTSGSLDIVSSVVPTKAGANSFVGLNTFAQLAITSSTPSSAAAACVADTVWRDSGFIYVCVSSGNIKRTAISSW